MPTAPIAMSPPPRRADIVAPGTSGTAGRTLRGAIAETWMPDRASSRERGPMSGRDAPATVQRASG